MKLRRKQRPDQPEVAAYLAAESAFAAHRQASASPPAGYGLAIGGRRAFDVPGRRPGDVARRGQLLLFRRRSSAMLQAT